MPIAEIARTNTVTVQPTASVDRIVEKLERNGVGSVVVVEDDAPVGIVTDRDLALQAAGDDSDAATAADLMTEDPFTVESRAGIFETVREMHEAGVRRVPVVDADDELVGIVTLDDLVVLLTSELGELSGVIDAESPPYPYEDPTR